MRQFMRWPMTYGWISVLLLVSSLNVQSQPKTLEDRLRLLEEAFKTDEKTFRVFWRDGVRMQTLDKEIDIRVGGRLQVDWNFYFPNDDMKAAFGDAEDRIFFRRAHLFLRGTLYKHFLFRLELDFAGDEVTFTDTYVGLQQIPYIGSLIIGRFKVPFGLEELTSSRFTTFQERSLTDAFVPSRELGFRLLHALLDERLTWAFSLTRAEGASTDSTSFVEGAADDFNVAARLTGLPLYVDKGRRLVHLGLAYVFRNFLADEARFRTPPEARLEFDLNADGEADSLRFVDSEEFGVQLAHQIGVEAALVFGPFSLQGEYMLACGFNPTSGLDPAVTDAIEEATFQAFYVMASFFLTGESRAYNPGEGIFDRPRPKKNFLLGGLGAWELAVRLSHIDLDDAEAIGGATAGGKELNLTFGVNWYPNPNIRVTANYVYGWVDRIVDGIAGATVNLNDDEFGVFMMRFQADF